MDSKIPHTIQRGDCFSTRSGIDDLLYIWSGVVQSDTNGNSIVGYVNEDSNGRNLNLNNLQNRWNRNYRIAAVVSERFMILSLLA